MQGVAIEERVSPARMLNCVKPAAAGRASLAEALGLLLCQESWAFAIFVSRSVLGDELFGAASYALHAGKSLADGIREQCERNRALIGLRYGTQPL